MSRKIKHIKESIVIYGVYAYERELVFLSHNNIIESTFKNKNGKLELKDPVSGTCRISRKNMPSKVEIWDVEYDYIVEELDGKEYTEREGHFISLEDGMKSPHSCLEGIEGPVDPNYYRIDDPYVHKAKGDKMFEDMIKKHVTVFRKDGNILQGFITEMDSKFIKMTELDNNMIVFSKDCIDLVRLGIQDINPVQQEVEKPPKMEFVPLRINKLPIPDHFDYDFNDEENPAYDEKAMASTPGEFAMALPSLSNDFEKPKKPVFHRATEKE